MKTRTRTTTETSSANTDLPAGYDDPDSPFYVHPDLRPFYLVDPDKDARRRDDSEAAQLWLFRRRNVAEAIEKNKTREPRHQIDLAQAARIGAVPRGGGLAVWTPTAAEWDEYFHAHRITDAATAKRNAEARAAAAEKNRRRQGCQVPGCENLTTAWSGWPDHQLTATLTLKLCPDCFHAWTWQRGQVAAAETFEHGTTRGEQLAALYERNRL